MTDIINVVRVTEITITVSFVPIREQLIMYIVYVKLSFEIF